MTTAATALLETYPRLPETLKEIISRARTIRLMSKTLNSVYIIDDRYVLRMRSIKLQPYDDIGSCANFAAAVTFLRRRGFTACPQTASLETTVSAAGTKEQLLFYPFVTGEPLTQVVAADTSRETEFAGQVGLLLAGLHAVETPHYGFFEGAQFPSWDDFVFYWLENQTFYIKKFGILDRNTIDRVLALFHSYRAVLHAVKPHAIHMDLSPANILVSGPDIHVIDWDNARGGDPAFDISYTLARAFRHYSKEFRNTLLRAYFAESQTRDTDGFMLRYDLSSLFMAYKLLPVHYTHTSLTGENTKDLVGEIGKLLVMRKW